MKIFNLCVYAATGVLCLFCLALAPAASAALLVNSGQEITIDAPSQDLEVRDGPGPGLDPTTLDVVDGAVIEEQDDLSIAVFENSILQMSGGETAGGLLISDLSQAFLSGGVIAGEVLVEGNATLRLSDDATVESDVVVEGAAQFVMTGGVIEGETVLADDAIGNISGGTLEDTLVAEGQAIITVHSVTAEDNVEAADDAVIHLLDGTFEGSVEAVDAAFVEIGGGSFPALFSDGEEVLATGGGRIVIHGGEFGEAGEEDDEGGIIAAAGGVVEYSGATIAGLEDGTAPTARFRTFINGRINVFNATFGNLALEAATGGRVDVGNVVATDIEVSALGGGIIDILGGTAETLEVVAELGGIVNLRGGSFEEIDVELVTESVLTVFGYSFTYFGTPVELLPAGAYVAATGELRTISGDLAGFLSDGSPFSMTFSRQFTPVPGARIFLVQVPEPGAAWLAGSAALALVCATRRRAGKLVSHEE